MKEKIIYNGLEKLEVEFYEVDCGMMLYKFRIGSQLFHSNFSNVFDPLPDFKHWLEAIAIGVHQTSFFFDNEGQDIKFNIERVVDDKYNFTILNEYDAAEVFLFGEVDRTQLISAFYLGFMSFIKSDKYIPFDWEELTLEEHLCDLSKLSKRKLNNELAKLNRNQLGLLFQDVYPGYSLNTKVLDEYSRLKEVWANRYNTIKGRKTTKDIPNEYDNWEKIKKKKFIADYIYNYFGYGGDGSKASDFRSGIIENYLKKNKVDASLSEKHTNKDLKKLSAI